jgi:hypothetical protein
MDNMGIVVVNEGEISEKELEQNFNEMWKVKWFSQIRKLSDKRFLVRFPPSKRIRDLVEYTSVNLKKKGVNVSFINWEGEAKPFEEFKEVWVNVEGIPCKYLTWRVIAQVASAIGVLVDVDWHVIFKSLYKKIRIKVSPRDSEKISPSKLFEFEQCFFLVSFDVEEATAGGEDNDNDNDAGNDTVAVDEDDDTEVDFQKEVDKFSKSEATGMDTDAGVDVPTTNVWKSVTNAKNLDNSVLERSVRAKVLEDKMPCKDAEVVTVVRAVEDNVGRHLLEEFVEESEEEENAANDTQIVKPPSIPIVQEKKKVWGPVLATRMSSRIARDGKSAIEKAQALKKAKNLEVPQGKKVHSFSNSFVALDDDNLTDKASAAGISLGSSQTSVKENIHCLKNIELDRLDKFHHDHPDMFLPQDISPSVEELVGSASNDQMEDDETHISEDSEYEEPWTEVSFKNRSRKKLIFK